MYRVMIVDDEIWSVIGLKKILEEDAEHFQVVSETTDSLNALEQISIICPDVVITDIRMPEMSGIELIHNMKERGVKAEFVVISGFAEFSYVQQALQEGAIDYLLKPFDRNAVKLMLDKLYSKLESKRNVGDLECYSLLRDKKENVADLLQHNFRHELYPKIQIVLLYYKNKDSKEIVFEVGEGVQCLCLRIGPRKCLCIINSKVDKTEAICDKIELINDKIEKAALSRVGDSIDLFEQLLKETEITIMNSFVYPENKIFRYKKSQRNVINHLEELIVDLHSNRRFRQISEIVSNLLDTFILNDMGVEDAVYLWNRMSLLFTKWSEDNNIILESLDIYELTERFSDMSEMCKYLSLQYLNDKVEQIDTVKGTFFEMLHYIEKNYAKELYLKELCNQFYINMSYCCVLFQRYKNMTFSQYLTDVRINKACELLKDYRITVSEACEMVGYKDYFYFNRVFKKKTGRTPSEYRKNETMES